MSDRLFGSAGVARADARVLVTRAVIVVYDHGPSAGPDERFAAELSGYAAVREAAASPWGAVRALVGEHRSLLERRWAPGGPAT